MELSKPFWGGSPKKYHMLIGKPSSFHVNLLSGSRILSSFELVNGCRPSILGIPDRKVTQELLDVHKEGVASGALQRLIQSRNNNATNHSMYQKDSHIYVCYDTGKQNLKDEWIPAIIPWKDHF